MTPRGGATLPIDGHPIRTDRLLLRPLTAADADDVYAYQSLPEAVRFLPWPLRDREESREHTLKRAGFTRLFADKDAIILAAELVGPTGEPGPVIGDMSIFLRDTANAQVAVGWVFHPSRQGRGYATEAATAVLDFVFREVGAHRVYAEVDPLNTASVALCLRLGMRLEGTLVENEFAGGEWSDLAIYAILDREWLADR
ncbi:MAG: GNAT family protein [Cryobacterium sp.]